MTHINKLHVSFKYMLKIVLKWMKVDQNYINKLHVSVKALDQNIPSIRRTSKVETECLDMLICIICSGI